MQEHCTLAILYIVTPPPWRVEAVLPTRSCGSLDLARDHPVYPALALAPGARDLGTLWEAGVQGVSLMSLGDVGFCFGDKALQKIQRYFGNAARVFVVLS